MATKRLVRDPDKIRTNRENWSDVVLAQQGVWEPAEFIEMDARFVAAMTRQWLRDHNTVLSIGNESAADRLSTRGPVAPRTVASPLARLSAPR